MLPVEINCKVTIFRKLFAHGCGFYSSIAVLFSLYLHLRECIYLIYWQRKV